MTQVNSFSCDRPDIAPSDRLRPREHAFGGKSAASNVGTVYTAKGTTSLFVSLGAVLAAGGNRDRVFLVAAVVSIGAGVAAKLILAPMRRKHAAKDAEAYSTTCAPPFTTR